VPSFLAMALVPSISIDWTHCVPRAAALPAWYGFFTLNMDRMLGTCVRGHPLFPPAVHSLGLAQLQRLGDCVQWRDRRQFQGRWPSIKPVVFPDCTRCWSDGAL
jgi:hypothetical protein